MFQKMMFAAFSLKSMINSNVKCLVFLAFFSSCQFNDYYECQYLDAFGKKVSISYYSKEKAKLDAEYAIKTGRWIVVGGYNEAGAITPLLNFGENSFNSEKLYDKFNIVPIEKLEKNYLTDGINKIKSKNFFDPDDGYIDDIQIDQNCYSERVIDYGTAFNRELFEVEGGA